MYETQSLTFKRSSIVWLLNAVTIFSSILVVEYLFSNIEIYFFVIASTPIIGLGASIGFYMLRPRCNAWFYWIADLGFAITATTYARFIWIDDPSNALFNAIACASLLVLTVVVLHYFNRVSPMPNTFSASRETLCLIAVFLTYIAGYILAQLIKSNGKFGFLTGPSSVYANFYASSLLLVGLIAFTALVYRRIGIPKDVALCVFYVEGTALVTTIIESTVSLDIRQFELLLSRP